jgi:flagellar basal-body rod protein FlgB
MLRNALFDKTNLPLLNRCLDTAMQRSRVINNNIANATTPGYKKVRVDFESHLRDALSRSKLQGTRTDTDHMNVGKTDPGKVHPHTYRPTDPTQPGGVNNVDIDEEMSYLAKNQILFNYGVRFLRGSYASIDAAIKQQTLK